MISIMNTISKSVTGPHQLTMDNEELFTLENMVIDKLNNCHLILGTPLGITLTPNCVLLGFRECYWGEINPDGSCSAPTLQMENHPPPLQLPPGTGIQQVGSYL